MCTYKESSQPLESEIKKENDTIIPNSKESLSMIVEIIHEYKDWFDTSAIRVTGSKDHLFCDGRAKKPIEHKFLSQDHFHIDLQCQENEKRFVYIKINSFFRVIVTAPKKFITKGELRSAIEMTWMLYYKELTKNENPVDLLKNNYGRRYSR